MELQRGSIEAQTQGCPSLLTTCDSLPSAETTGRAAEAREENGFVFKCELPGWVGLEKQIVHEIQETSFRGRQRQTRGRVVVGMEMDVGPVVRGGPSFCQEEGWGPRDNCVLVLSGWGASGVCSC